MKKQLFFFTTLFFFGNCIAQNDSSVWLLKRITQMESKIDNIDAFIKKMDSTVQQNKKFEKKYEEVKDSIYTINAEKDIVEKKLDAALDSINKLNQNELALTNFKSNYEKIVASLLNEHASFNPEILKLLEEANNIKPIGGINFLNTYNKVNRSIDQVKKYLKQPYDSDLNMINLNELAQVKMEASKFKNLLKDIDALTVLLNGYCSATLEVGNTINKSVLTKETRKPKLYIQKNKYKDYDFLIEQLNKASDNDEYTVAFKTNCTN